MRILFALKEISNKLSKDNITGYAAQSCFYITLSFFPFIMLLLTLIRFLPVKYDTIISILNEISPPQLHSFLDGIININFCYSCCDYLGFRERDYVINARS